MSRERLVLAALLAGLPALGWGLLIRPALRRNQALEARIRSADRADRELRTFTPVSREERRLLEDPAAPWRSRIPRVADDGARLAQVDRVVGQLDEALRNGGVRARAMRALLDPVEADFTVPEGLARGPRPARREAPDAPGQELRGWVLEVEIPGPPAQLFRALAAAARVEALLEPVGLRWEPAAGPGRARRRQFLLLRSLYLK